MVSVLKGAVKAKELSKNTKKGNSRLLKVKNINDSEETIITKIFQRRSQSSK